MGQQKMCLLCNTENVQYDDDFLNKRAHFSAPKLRELRIKWNEAISKIHPVLKGYVDNVNTYQICDLHFKESDIKKNFENKSTDNIVYVLPISKWGLKIGALPLSSKELGRQKSQILNPLYKKSKVEIRESKTEKNQAEKVKMNQEQGNKGNSEMDVQEDQSRNNNETDKIQETGKSTSDKEVQPEKDEIKKKEKNTPTKSTHRPIQPDYRKKVEVKFSPYSVLKSGSKGVESKTPQILQIKSGKNQVFVVSPSAKMIPISPSVIPVSLVNPVPPAIRVPVISQGPSLSAGSPIAKFVPVTQVSSLPRSCPNTNIIPITKVPSLSKVTLLSKAPIITTGSSITGVPNVPITAATKVTSAAKVTSSVKIISTAKIISPLPLKSAAKVNPPLAFSSLPSSPVIKDVEPYDKRKLTLDLQRYPLPSGWSYTTTKENKILFIQYCTLRKFPIYLSIQDDMTTKISVGHQAINFIQHAIELKGFPNVVSGLQKLETLRWCLGIGFNNNNHSDLCSILTERMNSRCKACSLIRKNEQRRETDEIQRLRKPPKDLKLLVKNLKRVNGRLEAKVCKMKLMVTHLKSKQCAECLHDKFISKTLSQAESASSAASKND